MANFYNKRLVHIILLIIVYLLTLFLLKGNTFSYKFDQELLYRYFLSQDIPHEVPGVRQFLSDDEIYTATGYLYATGEDPTSYNFQAPPLVKYLFGFSILFFGSPLYVQIILGAALILLVYEMGLKLYKSPAVALAACVLLMIDPVFLEVTSSALLDLGQAVFLLLYVYLVLWHKDRYYLQGIVLGLLASTKFWAGPLFFVIVLAGYNIYKKKFNMQKFALHILVACVVFSLTYIKTFINNGFAFNIVFFQLKILKFLLVHDNRSLPFASLLLFLTGFYQQWWGNGSLARSAIWSLFWPVGLLVSMTNAWEIFKKRFVDLKLFIGIIPLIYLLYLGIQAPFTRYFILILPFLYLNLSSKLFKR